MVLRIADNMVKVDDVILTGKDSDWKTFDGGDVTKIQLQRLYLFLQDERVAKRKAFEKYVDNVINELLYNEY